MEINIKLTSDDDQELLQKVLSAVAGTGDRTESVNVEPSSYTSDENPQLELDFTGSSTAHEAEIETSKESRCVEDIEITLGGEKLEGVKLSEFDDKLDADGLPWDHRIHASSKAKLKDGTWRKRRGVDDELVKDVEAELNQVLNVESNKSPLDSLVPPPPATEEPTFGQLLTRVSKLKADGVIDDEFFRSIYEAQDLPNFAAFNLRPDLIPAAWDKVKYL